MARRLRGLLFIFLYRGPREGEARWEGTCTECPSSSKKGRDTGGTRGEASLSEVAVSNVNMGGKPGGGGGAIYN
jgi:hypothetical protein